MHVYQIIVGLREVAAWVRDIYPPWSRKHVLGGYIDALSEDAKGRGSST